MRNKSSGQKKIHCSENVGRENHIRAMQLASKKKSTQLLLQETASMKDNKLSDFHKNFCEALVSANTPFSALNNAELKSFLELHFGRPIPDESTLRKNYLSRCYDDTISKIRGQVHGKKIFTSIDEMTDASLCG